MHVLYYGDKAPEAFSRSLFLVGPSPRSSRVQSWRPQALELLRRAGYDGVVFVPEFRDGQYPVLPPAKKRK